MAQESMLWNTTGTGHGPVGGYTQAQWIDYHRYFLTPDNEATAYIFPRKGNKLAVTAGASKVTVDTGGAIGYGFMYKNTAAVDVNIATPLLGTTGFIVVLRVSWAAQTVVAAVVRNSDGVAAIPAATQTPNTTYELVLAEGTITTGGLVTITLDRRGYLNIATEVIEAMMVNNAVSDAKLRDSAALSVIGRASNTSGDPADIVAASDGTVLLRAGTVIGFGQVGGAGIFDGSLTDAKFAARSALSVIGRSAASIGSPADIVAGTDGYVLRRSGATLGFGQVATAGVADNAIDYTKAGDGIPQQTHRQGGDANDWSVEGNNNYAITATRRFAGVKQWSGAAAASGSVAVTFPTAFSNKPIVMAVRKSTGSGVVAVTVENVTAVGFTIHWVSTGTTFSIMVFNWTAEGPE